MTTGDTEDMAGRIRATLPTGWFADEAPVLTAILLGLGAAWAAIYLQMAYVQAQTRLATATGEWLDARAEDFLPASFRRRTNEADAVFSLRVRREIVRPRVTRAALIRVIEEIGGTSVRVFEPARPADVGGYGRRGRMGYGVAGRWGSLRHPAQVFVHFNRPQESAVARRYGWGRGGYRAGNPAWTSGQPQPGDITDAELYRAIAAVLPAGVTAWVQLGGIPSPHLWILDQTPLDAAILG